MERGKERLSQRRKEEIRGLDEEVEEEEEW